VRRGVRVGRSTLVVHAWSGDQVRAILPGRVVFVVPKAVGGAVVRNRVKRRLRAMVRPLLATDTGCDFVVRVLPAAAEAGGSLTDDLTTAWAAASTKAGLA